MNYAGFYINLDRSTARRSEMEAQFAQYGFADRYRRFPAAEGNTLGFPAGKIVEGEMGCFTSHYLLLKENLGQNLPLHVIEDDVLFSRYTGDAIQSLIAGDRFDHYDIIYTDVHIPISNVVYKKYKSLYDKSIQRDGAGDIAQLNLSVVDLKDVGFAATASMVVSPRAIRKLHDLYAAELEKGPLQPIDIFIRAKTDEGVLKAGSIFPFVTSVRLEHTLGTTMDEQDLRLVALAGTIARHSFFVDCDMKKCRDYALKHVPTDPDDIHLQVLTHILGFTLNSSFRFA